MADDEDVVDTPMRSGDESSDSGSESEDSEPVEWLATGREKRSTAGNRLTTLVQQEGEDDDLELLFAEAEDDEGFEESDGDASDVQMDSSSDDEDQGPTAGADDLEGERELQQEARAAAKKRKANDFIPKQFRKKVKIDPTAPIATKSTPPRPKKKSERASWIPTAEDAPTRASSRGTTKKSKEQLHAQMLDRERRRLKQLEKIEKSNKHKDQPREMTQAEHLAEAARVEKKNAKSLNRWEEAEKIREEEQRAKLAALHNRKLEGPVITFWSGVTEWEGETLKRVGKNVTIEEKKEHKKRKEREKDKDKDKEKGKDKDKDKEEAKGEEKGKDMGAENAPKEPTSEGVPPAAVPTAEDAANPLVAVPSGADPATAAPETEQQISEQQAKEQQPSEQQSSTPEESSEKVDSASKPLVIASDAVPESADGDTKVDPSNTSEEHEIKDDSVHIPASPKEKDQDTEMLDAKSSAEDPSPAEKAQDTEMPDAESTAEDQADASNDPTQKPASEIAAPPQNDESVPPTDVPAPPKASSPPAVDSVNGATQPLDRTGPSDGKDNNITMPPERTEPSDGNEKVITAPSEEKDTAENPPPEPAQPNDAVAESDAPKLIPSQTTPFAFEPTEAPAIPEAPPKVSIETRNCLILENFDETAVKNKDVQAQIIFGKKFPKAHKAPPHPVCVITGYPAKFRDPSTGLPYCNAYAYKEIHRLKRGDYVWSNLLQVYVGQGHYAARGVPSRFLQPRPT